jgi:phosphotransferase system HPr (HPr) family protein
MSGAADATAVGTTVVVNPHGIHARPSHSIVTAAQTFRSRIELEYDGRRADARSILSIMTLGAPCGATVTVRTLGPDAAVALAAILQLVSASEPR